MAYAALVSLVRILDELLHTNRYPVDYPKARIESLYHKVCFLQDCFESVFRVAKSRRSEVNDLEIEIRDVLYEAQDIVEMFISNQICSSESEEILFSEIIAKLDSVIEKAEKMMNCSTRESQRNEEGGDSTLQPDLRDKRGDCVGRVEDLSNLMEVLTGRNRARQVVLISGLAGIGKTTCARYVFNNPFIEQYFDVRCWVIVSIAYNVMEILSYLLDSLGVKLVGGDISEDEFGVQLYKVLYGRRYLVVMDDIWDVGIWDKVRRYFPVNDNGSRIVMTSRNAALAHHISNIQYVMQPLDQETSWMLLRDKVFGEEVCPPELKDVGRSIAEKCDGIPLSIVMVAGLLSKAIRTVEYWENLDADLYGAAASGDEAYLKILALSYNNLPSRLKACFLYMGAFRKGTEILVSRLIKLWVAEGFLKHSSQIEQVAEQHLKDLIDRNLVSIRRISSDGRAKTCSIQGNLNQLFIEDRFFHTINSYAQDLLEGMPSQRRVSVHNNILMWSDKVYKSLRSNKLVRTLLFAGPDHLHPLPFYPTFDLLRVLDALTVYFIELPNAMFELIHLRYLSFTYDEDLPPLISKLRNLLILIIRQHPKIMSRRASVLPEQIWNMPEIRHLLVSESVLPDPSGKHDSVLLENLQSLSNISADSCTREVLRNMPNLKKLGIWVEKPGAVHFYLDQLGHLEALKFSVLKPIHGEKMEFLPLPTLVWELPTLVFPTTLKKLSLSGCGLPWEDMTIIGILPCLQVLKLRELAFQGPKWSPNNGEFQELKFLLLESLDLEEWDADDSHFPRLERLIIRHCYELEYIGCDVPLTETLKLIELVDCSPSVVVWAQETREERLDLGYPDFQLHAHCSWK